MSLSSHHSRGRMFHILTQYTGGQRGHPPSLITHGGNGLNVLAFGMSVDERCNGGHYDDEKSRLCISSGRWSFAVRRVDLMKQPRFDREFIA